MRPEYPRFSIPTELLIPLNFSPYQLRLSSSGHMRYAVVIQNFTRNCSAIFDSTQSNTPPSTNIVVNVDLLLISSRRANANQLAEFLHVDVAPRNDGDDRSFAGFPGQCSRDRQSARAFGNNPRFLRHQTHRFLRFVQTDHDIIVHGRFHPIPHPREHALTTSTVYERLLEILEHLRRSSFERKRCRRGRLRLDAEDFDRGLERFDRAANSRDKPAASYAGDHGCRVGRVFKNLETHRSMAGDEIVIVERVHERSFGSGERTFL